MEGKYVGKSSATIKVNGKELSDDKEKAEAFMKEYASVSRLPQDKRDRQYKEALITGLRRVRWLPRDENRNLQPLYKWRTKPSTSEVPIRQGSWR